MWPIKKHRGRNLALVIALVLVIVVVIVGISTAYHVGFPGGVTPAIVATKVTCTSMSPAICNVTLLNTGTEDLKTLSCAIDLKGSAISGTNGGQESTNIPAGSVAVNATCTINVSGGTPGYEATGYFTLSSGKTVDFAGTWS